MIDDSSDSDDDFGPSQHKQDMQLEKLENQPFHRRTRKEPQKFNENQLKSNLLHLLKSLDYDIDENAEIEDAGLLTILEYCLENSTACYLCFEKFINALGYNTVHFWRYAVPYIYDSDLTYGTKFRDSLLFSLTLFDVSNARNKLR
ncbi:unnamed protein product [Thelazia callipaeda]|uniref:Uncharacterized protein n=1 Tax=Thelazia callipaeda TaxID=103827 RepID=A0A0N5D159_THECL|nr:unnamed protein product [Thelazia callipaeda]